MSTSNPPSLPVEPAARRVRVRRGGPRTPLPLLPIMAIAAGVGIAYVSQTAQSTQTTYAASTLSAQQQLLRAQDQQLADELARLGSSERIVAGAQQLGMRPAGTWSYVASQHVQVIPGTPAPQLAASAGSDPLQELVGALSGDAGTGTTAR